MSSKAPLPTAFSEEQLNRYRITHPDRDIRPLIRRIHRLPLLGPDDTAERDLAWLELLKWKVSVERMMGGVEGLEKERDGYVRKAEETSERKVDLERRLGEEKVSLVKKETQRQFYIQCDEVAKRITDRGKTMAQLDEEIEAMEASLKVQRESYQQYVQIAESRVEIFNRISALAEECKGLKLPVEFASSSSTMIPESNEEPAIADKANEKGKSKEEEGERSEAMDVDMPSSSSSSRLNVQALPFQPTPASSSQSVPTPATTASTTTRAMKPPPSSLPVRPQASASTTSSSSRLAPPPMSRTTSSSLPNRPASKASAGSTKAKGLEEGELNDVGEDGEVIERASGSTSGRGVKRGIASSGIEGSRSSRSRK